MTVKAAVKKTVKNPLLVTVCGAVTGILTLAEGYFASGHMPAGTEVVSVLAGSGLTLGSVLGYVAHDLGLTKARLSSDAATAVKVAEQIAPVVNAVNQMPGVAAKVTALEAQVAGLVGSTPAQIDHIASLVKAQIITAIAPGTPA